MRSVPPWRHPGYQESIEAWLDAALAARGTPRIGPTTPVRDWELSYVFAAPTTAGRVFVKAGVDLPLFGNEGTVTAALAEILPGDVPEPIAVDAERRWMALPDLGEPLGWDQPLDVYADLVRHYARLQIASAAHLPRLWAAGCLDRRVGWAVEHGTRWLTETDLSPWLSADEAVELRRRLPGLPERAAVLTGFGLPDTVLHGDMHGANVMRRPGGYAFIDWTDAAVGHPFVDMISIREVEDTAARGTLRDAYLSQWAEFGPPERLRAAWDAAEPLTCLHHAISYGVIVTSVPPPVEKFLMSNTVDWLRRLSRSLDDPAAGPSAVAGRQAGGSPRA